MNVIQAKVENTHDIEKPSTEQSVGYDIRTPQPIHLQPGQGCMVDTGIVLSVLDFDEPVFPLLALRSSAGCDYDLTLKNTVGIIDPDYCGPDDTLKCALYRRFVNPSQPGELLADIRLDFGDDGYSDNLLKDDDFLHELLRDYVLQDMTPNHGTIELYNDMLSVTQEGKTLAQMAHQSIWEGNDDNDMVRILIKRPSTQSDMHSGNVLYEKGERFAQVLFLPYRQPNVDYFLTDEQWNEHVDHENRGGFGSTGVQ